ncbi:hypothetical protein FMEAI12_7090015 [Parafrankia sp. Ea1.12]|nr:hypothetical protein FMEAI12_7090015 [Parafrankia sp. Ea1.12]
MCAPGWVTPRCLGAPAGRHGTRSPPASRPRRRWRGNIRRQPREEHRRGAVRAAAAASARPTGRLSDSRERRPPARRHCARPEQAGPRHGRRWPTARGRPAGRGPRRAGRGAARAAGYARTPTTAGAQRHPHSPRRVRRSRVRQYGAGLEENDPVNWNGPFPDPSALTLLVVTAKPVVRVIDMVDEAGNRVTQAVAVMVAQVRETGRTQVDERRLDQSLGHETSLHHGPARRARPRAFFAFRIASWLRPSIRPLTA